jgi:hypothetical protein
VHSLIKLTGTVSGPALAAGGKSHRVDQCILMSWPRRTWHVSVGGLVQPQVLASQQVVELGDVLVTLAPQGGHEPLTFRLSLRACPFALPTAPPGRNPNTPELSSFFLDPQFRTSAFTFSRFLVFALVHLYSIKIQQEEDSQDRTAGTGQLE